MALVVAPLYPLEGEDAVLSLTVTSGSATVYSLTSVPSASALSVGLLLTDVPAGIAVPEDAVDAVERGYSTNTFTPDVPGEYGVTAYDLVQWLGIPSYPGDPAGEQRWQLVASQSGTVNVGKAVDLPILTVDGRGATLRLSVVNETVRDADLVDATDEWARACILGAGVVATLAALGGAGVAVNSIGNDLSTDVADLRTKYEAHRVVVGGCHANADATNTVLRTAPNSTAGALLVLSYLEDAILGHLKDSSTAATRWHTGGAGTPADDFRNLPITGTPGTLAQATVFCADLRYRCYARHRVQTATPASHGIADPGNALTAATVLDNVIVAYLDELATIAPAAVAGEPEGVMDARQRYGFT